MTHQLYWFSVLMYLLGQLLFLMWITIPDLKEKSRIANKGFSLLLWLKCDYNIVIGNMVFGAVLIIGIDQLVQWKPVVLDYVKWFFFIVGAFGTSIFQEKFGQFKKGLSKLIDVKTNIADAVTGGTTSVKETVIRAAENGIDATQRPVN